MTDALRRSQVQLAIDEAMVLCGGGISPEQASRCVTPQFPALEECGEDAWPLEECLDATRLTVAIYERIAEEMRDGQ